MKKRIILVFLIFIILSISIFNYYRRDSDTSWDNVHIYVKKDTITTTSATIVCKNKNKLKYDNYFFDKFYIDKKVEENWYELPILESYIVLGEFCLFESEDGAPYTYENTINWVSKYGELSKGETYRIRFEPGYYNSKEPVEKKGVLTVEFKL